MRGKPNYTKISPKIWPQGPIMGQNGPKSSKWPNWWFLWAYMGISCPIGLKIVLLVILDRNDGQTKLEENISKNVGSMANNWPKIARKWPCDHMNWHHVWFHNLIILSLISKRKLSSCSGHSELSFEHHKSGFWVNLKKKYFSAKIGQCWPNFWQ